jgi:hypothetical protein
VGDRKQREVTKEKYKINYEEGKKEKSSRRI